jgi:hypothetical protein
MSKPCSISRTCEASLSIRHHTEVHLL